MVDNVTADAGSGGAVFATDDIGGVHYPINKLTFGALDSQTIASSGAGNVDAGTQRVVLASDQAVVSVDDNSGSLTVDWAGTAPPIGAGVEATALRVTLATDSTGVISVDDNGGALTVDGTVTANLGATDNAVLDSIDAAVNGTLTVGSHAVTNAGTFAVQESNAHTADFDSGAGTDTTSAFGIAVPASGGAVVVPGDATAGLKVDLGSDNDVTVTGTVDLGATDNAVLDSIVTNTADNATETTLSALNAKFVTGTDIGDVDVTSVVPGTGATNLGKAIDSVAGATDTGVPSLAIRDDSLTTLTPVDGDYVPLRVSSTGALHVTGGGGGTEYTEDVATANPIVGSAVMMERDDALSTLTPIEGDWASLRCDSQGALWVNAVNAGGTATDDAAFTVATDTVAVIGALADETATDSVDEGDVGAVRMSLDRRLLVDAQIAGQDADVTIADGGNSITVDNGGTFAVQSTLQANSGVDIGDVDVTSIIPGTGATNLGKAVDSAAGGTDTGVPPLAIRDDALSALTPVEGDYVPLRVNSTGALHVTGGGGGTQYNIDDALGATDTVTLAGVVRDDSLTTLTEADGDVSVLRVSSTGALHVTGGGGGTEYTEDVATANPIVGSAVMMERDDALATLTPIEGDWASLRCSAEGALWVQEFNSDAILADTANMDTNLGTIAGDTTSLDGKIVVGAGTEAGAVRVTVATDSTGVLSVDDNGGALTVDNAGTFATQVNGAALTALQLIDNPIVAHDAAATGSTGVNMLGARATNSVEGITQVANADATRVQADLNGVLLSRPHTTLEEHISERVSNTNGTSTAFTNFAAGGAGIHNYVTDVTVYNSSATDGYVDFRDGTAGSIIWTFPLPATGGATHSFSIPLKGAANTALAYDVSGALSTVYISVNGFQAQG